MDEVLRIHAWPDRVVVDLEEDDRSECYLAIDMDTGDGLLRLGLEKCNLSRKALDQIAAVIHAAHTGKEGDGRQDQDGRLEEADGEVDDD